MCNISFDVHLKHTVLDSIRMGSVLLGLFISIPFCSGFAYPKNSSQIPPKLWIFSDVKVDFRNLSITVVIDCCSKLRKKELIR